MEEVGMELHILDHIVAALLILAMPVYAIWAFRRLLAHLAAGVDGARIHGYWQTMVMEWTLSAGVIALWLLSGRELAALGLGIKTGLGWWAGAGLGLAACGILLLQARVALRDPENLPGLRKQFGRLEHILPRAAAEIRTFNALSITAGICEELLYRGYLIAYLRAELGTWPAFLLSSLAFGIGHSYQGPKGVLKTGIVGLVMAGLYLISGSLLVPMIVHAVIDLTSGHIGRKALDSNGG
jgi:membrane protease YdiL (CAAX protease family)